MMKYRTQVAALLAVTMMTLGAVSGTVAPRGHSASTRNGTGDEGSITYRIAFFPASSDGDSSTAKASRIAVDLEWRGDAGETTFDVPERWADQSHLETAIDSLHLVSRGVLHMDDLQNGTIRVEHTRGSSVHLHYILRQDWRGPIARATYFRTIIQPQWFLLLGHNALITPRTSDAVRLELQWRVPSGGTVATSWGDGAVQRATARPEDLRNAVYAGGTMRKTSYRERSTDLTLLSIPAQRSFDDSAFIRLAARVVNPERTFWGETAKAHYLVTLLPSTNDLGGTRYEHAMALFADPKYPLAAFASLVGHESFHEWLGGRMPQPSDGGETAMKWFAEGFTDYYGDRILRDTGIMTDSTYADAVNRVIRQYYTSPARDASQDRIEREYWTNPDVNRIPYQRGRLFALRLDGEVRAATSGTKSMDDVMRKALRLIPDSMPMSRASVVAAARGVAEKLVSDDIERYVVAGNVLEIPATAMGSCFRMDSTSIAVFDLGFDLAASREAKKITGVRPGSHAYDAGMRDGMGLRSMNVWNGDVTKDATFGVKDETGERSITYRPVLPDSARVPQFVAQTCDRGAILPRRAPASQQARGR